MPSRRTFLRQAFLTCALGATGSGFSRVFAAAPKGLHRAEHYRQVSADTVQCLLCPNACIRKNGERGNCHVRGTIDGAYYSFVYGRPCVLAIDPVEKCPLFHFHPAANAFSIATAGCNLTCKYCQNWQFSQKPPEEVKNYELDPAGVIAKAREYKASLISFFYTEPTICFEYMKDIARAARQAGLGTVMVTAGYIQPKPLQELFPLIDAFTVGLKGFTADYYRNVIGGTLEPVLQTLKLIHAAKKHLEIVTLVVPTLNDQTAALRQEIDWVAAHLGTDVPLHFTRFTPQYQLKGLPPTPVGILQDSRNQAMKAGIKFVYTGNVPGDAGNHTHCPSCRKTLIERLGFKVIKNTVVNGTCPDCRTPIPGIWK